MFCFIFCLIWRGNSDQQSYANDKIIFVVIGYKKVRTFSNKGLYRESSDEMWLMNMVEETFSYLNISKINSAEVQNDGECAFACLNEPMCFSYNLEASASKTGTRVCELLPSDKYNNSDEVIISQKFHHYSIQVSDLMFNIKKNSTCSGRNAPGVKFIQTDGYQLEFQNTRWRARINPVRINWNLCPLKHF